MSADPKPDAVLHGGRTNLVWRAGDIVHKKYRSDRATPMFRNDPGAEWAILIHLSGQNIGPDPVDLRRDASGDWVLQYRHLDGMTHATSPEDLAGLLGRLHRLPVPHDLVRTPTGAAVLEHGCDMAAGAATLRRAMPAPPPPCETLAICHRDVVPGNVVQTPNGARLIDWQCPGACDPVEDIAHALSPAMHLLYGGDGPHFAAFLAAYPDQNVVDRYRRYGAAYHWRLACYCHWQVTRNGGTAYGPAYETEMALLNTL